MVADRERAVADAIAGDSKVRDWLSRDLRLTPAAGAPSVHEIAVRALFGVDRVEAVAESAELIQIALEVIRVHMGDAVGLARPQSKGAPR